MDRKGPKGLFYGWYIVSAAFVILFFNSGARYAFGVMFKPIIAEFGWSRAAVSSVFSVNMVIFAIALLIVGKLYDRYGPKWVIIISTLFLSAGLVLTSFMRSFAEFFFSYGILAAFGIAGTAVPLMATLTSKWFDKWRGFAISSALSGNSIGQFALVPLLSLVALDFGWRTSYLYIGIAMLVVNVFLVLFVIKGDPEHLGLKPFGHVDREKGSETAKSQAPSMPLSRDMGLKEAMGTSSFWIFALVMFICGGGDYVAATHLIPMATDYGIPPMTAGWMLSLYGVMSLAGILIAGPAADVIGNKIIIIITFVMRIFLFAMLLKYKSVASLYVFAAAFGFTHLITAPLTPMLIGKLYGVMHLGVLTGFINTAHFLGAAFWPYVAGYIFDKMGNYRLAFALLAIMAFVAAVSMLFIKERRHLARASSYPKWAMEE
jgi:MFS family permease